MSVKTTIRNTAGVSIIDLDGRLVLGPDSQAFSTSVASACETNRNLLVNLENVSYLDSAGLGELIGAYSSVTRRGGVLKLLRPSQRVMTLLQVTKADKLFEIFDDEAAAMASFSSTP